MAIIKRSELIQGGQTPLPKNNYTCIITAAEVKTAQGEGKRPTLRVTAEILSPTLVEYAGRKWAVGGRRFRFMPNLINADETWALPRIEAALAKSGFDFALFGADGDIDTDKFACIVGHRFDMVLESIEQVSTREATKEEIEAGQATQDYRKRWTVPVLDGNGQPIVTGYEVQGDWDLMRAASSGATGNPY